MLTRRAFIRNSALAVVGTAAIPSFLTRAALGALEPGIRNKRLVVIFQRGAADGLNIVVPHGERDYYAMRPTINIPRSAVIDLDGKFGLHPSMSAFQPLWKQGHLAIVHAAGSPDPSRSHFDAQDFMESGTPGIKATEDGWLNRTLHDLPTQVDKAAFRAIAMGPSLPRIHTEASLRSRSITSQTSVSAYAVPELLPSPTPSNRCTRSRSTQFCIARGRETFDAVKRLKSADPGQYKPMLGANYPRGRFGDSLRQLAQLIRETWECKLHSPISVDGTTTSNEGNTQGQLANVLGDFSQSLAAFWTDIGDLGEETVVITMSEFGRTARENGARGTDHGHANVMFVLGGPVKGGKVYGRWPGLDQSQLYEGRDLAVTTDFRNVISEALDHHLENKSLNKVFPGFETNSQKYLQLIG